MCSRLSEEDLFEDWCGKYGHVAHGCWDRSEDVCNYRRGCWTSKVISVARVVAPLRPGDGQHDVAVLDVGPSGRIADLGAACWKSVGSSSSMTI